MIGKLSYILFIISLRTGYLCIYFLRILAPLISKKKTYDLLLFPDKQKGSDGYLRRFQEYFKFLEADKISFDVADIYDHDYICEFENEEIWKKYYIYHRIFWKRFFQVLKARKYRAVFIHRKLFAYYPDQRYPVLLSLLRKLNNNIVLDYWDSIYIHDPEHVKYSIKLVDKLSLVNQHLFNYFDDFHDKKYIWPLGVNTNRYIVKHSYDFNGSIKFVWTGLPWNLPNLGILKPVFEKLSVRFPVEVVIIGQESYRIEGVKVKHEIFDINTFFKLLPNMDIGIYPLTEDIELCKGKMAMKVLDFMSAGLPVIGSPYGLSPYAKNEENILFAETEEDWIKNLTRLIESKNLRKKLGENARKMVKEYHGLEKSYGQFKEIVFS